METNRRISRWVGSAALIASGLVAGGVLASANIAGAADSGTSSTAPVVTIADDDNGTHEQRAGETLLTGTTAEKVTAAAKAAVPGATVMRVETDADGAKYEAHMRKADGSCVTVKLDENFKVTSIEEGHGPRHQPAGTSNA